MKGLLLAGGSGSRLWPATAAVSKQLLNCAGRPLCYFPLVALMEAGIREVCIITMPHEAERFIRLFGDGKRLGMRIEYRKQPEPRGIAEAFIIGKSFIGRDAVTLILGDNIFIGDSIQIYSRQISGRPCGADILAVCVANPKRYGVVTFGLSGQVESVREKPKFSSSKWAVPGLYSFAPSVVEIAQGLTPSARGEIEIVDVISEYNRRGQLRAHKLPRSIIWMDAGTPSDLMEATCLIHALEKRTGTVIGSPELAALNNEWIDKDQFKELLRQMPECEYKEKLSS